MPAHSPIPPPSYRLRDINFLQCLSRQSIHHCPCLHLASPICHSSSPSHPVESSICIASFESERDTLYELSNHSRSRPSKVIISVLHLKSPNPLCLTHSSAFRLLQDLFVLHPAKFNCPILPLFNPHSSIIDPKMSNRPSEHVWVTLRSRTCLVYWSCEMCYSGPHMLIYECLLCRRKVCRRCSIVRWSFDRTFWRR